MAGKCEIRVLEREREQTLSGKRRDGMNEHRSDQPSKEQSKRLNDNLVTNS